MKKLCRRPLWKWLKDFLANALRGGPESRLAVCVVMWPRGGASLSMTFGQFFLLQILSCIFSDQNSKLLPNREHFKMRETLSRLEPPINFEIQSWIQRFVFFLSESTVLEFSSEAKRSISFFRRERSLTPHAFLSSSCVRWQLAVWNYQFPFCSPHSKTARNSQTNFRERKIIKHFIGCKLVSELVRQKRLQIGVEEKGVLWKE